MSGPVRVLHVLEATEGGTRRWLENVVLSLDQDVIRSSCILANHRDPTFSSSIEGFLNRGIEVWVIDMRRNIHPFRDLLALKQISAILRDSDVDIVHCHSSKAGAIGRLALRRSGKDCISVYSPHGFAFLNPSPGAPFYRLVEKKMVQYTDSLLAVSNSEGKIAKDVGYHPDSIRVIENGVRVEGTADSESMPPSDGVFRVGFVGAYRRQKDPETFVRACALLKQRGADSRFEMCGTGPLEGRISALISRHRLTDAIDRRGRVPNARELMRSWNLLVLCSRFEGLPYALLEAMAEGIPVIGTRVPGIEEVIEHGETGLLVPPQDPNAIADAVTFLREDPRVANEMGHKGREKVKRQYSLAKQTERLTKFYQGIV